MTYVLLIIFYLLFSYISYRQIHWGVYLILILLPTYQIRYQVFGIPGTLLEGMIWLLLIVWLIKLHKEKGLTLNPLKIIKNISSPQSSALKEQNLIPKPFRLPIILFLVTATISAFISPQFQSALGIWKAYFVEALMFFIIFIYNLKPEHLKQVIRILGVLTIGIGLFAIYQKLTGNFIPNPFWAAESTRRVTTFFGYPNANALLIAPILILTLGNLLTDKKLIFQSFNFLVLILGFLTILWSESAGALLGLVVGIIFFLIFYKKTRLITLMVMMLAILIFIPQIQNKLQQYYITSGEIHLSDKPSDIQLRVQQWRETLNMMKDTPIFGPGLSGYQTLMVPYHQNQHIEIFLYPHNFFLNFWSETGLLGLVTITWILVIFFWLSVIGHRSLKDQKPITNNRLQLTTINTLTLTTSCAMIALLIHGLVDVPYFKNDLSILFWVIVGMIIIIYQDTRNNQQASPAMRSMAGDTNKIQ